GRKGERELIPKYNPQISQITPGDSLVTRVEDMIRTAVSFRSCRPAEVRNRNLRNLCNLRIYLRFSSCPLCLGGENSSQFGPIRLFALRLSPVRQSVYRDTV